MDGDSLTEPLHSPQAESRSVTARRAVIRFAAFAVTLLVVDVALGLLIPRPDFTADWRMPRELPTSQLAPFIAHFEQSSDTATEPVVAFVGASPTWGAAVLQERDTVPSAFRRQSERTGNPVLVYNFACNGQLLGDSYFITRRIAQRADVVFIQLTYHGFNGVWRQGATHRYPDIPARLGVPVDAHMSDVLGIEPSHRPDITGAVDRWLQQRWYLYGSRDALAARLLGTTPEQHLYTYWERLTLPDFEGEQDLAPSESSFEALDPDAQTLILDEFTEAADFRIDDRDSEVRTLMQLTRDLEAQGTRVVFYLSPLNVEALSAFDLLDEERYAANARAIRAICVEHGHRFIDFNTETSIPGEAFADINHTTPEGSEQVARELHKRTADLLEVAP